MAHLLDKLCFLGLKCLLGETMLTAARALLKWAEVRDSIFTYSALLRRRSFLWCGNDAPTGSQSLVAWK
jgi:hypothetical protein